MFGLWLLFASNCSTRMAAASSSESGALHGLVNSPGPTPYLNGEALVSRNAKVEIHFAHGFSDFARSIPIRPNAVFQLASLTKVFTSTAVLQLVEGGRVDLDAAVQLYLPRFPFPNITVRHLLAHQSGLPNLELYEDLVARDTKHVVTSQDTLTELAAWKPGLAFTPGTQFRYCNTNYVVLAQLVEAVSGETFSNYLGRHIFKPAGMRSSYTLSTLPEGKAVKAHVIPAMFSTRFVDVKTVVLSDARAMRRYRYELHNLGSTQGDQNVFSTAGDLLKFDRALRDGKLLTLATQTLAYTPAKLADGTVPVTKEPMIAYGAPCGYGLGWDVCEHPERGKIVGHGGYNRGIKTLLYRELRDGITIAMYDNANGNQFDTKAASIANVLRGREPLPIERRKSATRAYGEALLRDGAAAALILYNRLRLDSAIYTETQDGMNVLGYDLLRNGYGELALEAFRINLVRYPGDFNAYDSFGEALGTLGRREDAIRMYERAIELEPEAEDSIRALNALRAK